MSKKKPLHIAIPKQLAKKEIIEAIGIGLHYILIGERPESIPDGGNIKKRIYLNESEENIFNLAKRDFRTKKETIITALAWLSEKPAHVMKTKI